MSIGSSQHLLDKKNRLFLPSQLRRQVLRRKNNNPVLTAGLEGCLFLYAWEEWGKITQKLDSLPSLSKVDIRAFKRIFLSLAHEVKIDNQGRILLPRNLSLYAKIKQEIILIGVLDHWEIWAKEQWQKYQNKVQPTYTKIAEELGI